MEKKLRMIKLGQGIELPWIETMTVSYEKAHQGNVDSMQDLQREMAFYAQAKDAMDKGLTHLEDAQIPIDRPPDYFAEMVSEQFFFFVPSVLNRPSSL